MTSQQIAAIAARNTEKARRIIRDTGIIDIWESAGAEINLVGSLSTGLFIIRKSKCSTDFKRNDFLKKNEAYPLGALRSLKFAYRKLRISLFVELAV